MFNFIRFSWALLLVALLLFYLCPTIAYSAETGEDADAAEPADDAEPTVAPEGVEGEKDEEDEPLTLEYLKKKYDELEKKMKEEGAQSPDSKK